MPDTRHYVYVAMYTNDKFANVGRTYAIEYCSPLPHFMICINKAI